MSRGFETDDQDLTVTSRREGDAAVVALDGELTVFSSPMLRDRLREVVDAGPKRVVLDLSNVRYVDSSGVATFVEALRLARQAGGDMALAHVNPRVRGVLEIARLDTLFPIADSVEEALNS